MLGPGHKDEAVLGPQELLGVGEAGVQVQQLQAASQRWQQRLVGHVSGRPPWPPGRALWRAVIGAEDGGTLDDGEVEQGGAPGTRVGRLEPWGH